jgi:hypothetical protein
MRFCVHWWTGHWVQAAAFGDEANRPLGHASQPPAFQPAAYLPAPHTTHCTGVGDMVGRAVGLGVGVRVGDAVGLGVGARVGIPRH